MDFGELLLRIVVTIVTLTIMSKINGAKQIGQLTFFDYITGIIVAAISGELCLNHDVPILFGIFAICFFLLHSYLVSIYTRKSIKLRRYFIGEPIILIKKRKDSS